jgi:hypothetical protein
MKKADSDILGGLFEDFKSGWKFGSDVVDTSRRRKIENEQHSEWQRSQPTRLALAQTQAAQAKLKLEQAPKKFQMDQERLDLDKSGHQLGVDTLEHNKGAPKRKEEEDRRNYVLKEGGEFFNPSLGAQATNIPWETRNTPEGQAQLNALRAKDLQEKQKYEAGLAGARRNAAELVTTREHAKRTQNTLGYLKIEGNLGPSASKDLTYARKLFDEAQEMGNIVDMGPKIEAAENSAMATINRVMLNPKSLTYQTDLNTAQGFLNEVRAKKQELKNMMSGGGKGPAAVPAPTPPDPNLVQQLKAMSPEQRAAMLEQLRAKKAAMSQTFNNAVAEEDNIQAE